MEGCGNTTTDGFGGDTLYKANQIVMIFAFVILPLDAQNAVTVKVADYVEQGGVLQIGILGKLLDNVMVTLDDATGTAMSHSQGMIWVSPEGKKVNVALLGIPSHIEPGEYHINLQAKDGNADWAYQKLVVVQDAQYPEYVIELSPKMDNAYNDKSPEKKEQSLHLWNVLKRFDEDAYYHYSQFRYPFENVVQTSPFGQRRRYIMPDGEESLSLHFGLDLWDTPGNPVFACGAGRIVLAEERILTGNSVIIEHLPGVHTVYYHLDTISVELGQVVKTGQEIGTVGETGFATGVHLHWELRISGTAVQPQQFINRALLDTRMLIE